jgi:hypothetical protein
MGGYTDCVFLRFFVSATFKILFQIHLDQRNYLIKVVDSVVVRELASYHTHELSSS